MPELSEPPMQESPPPGEDVPPFDELDELNAARAADRDTRNGSGTNGAAPRSTSAPEAFAACRLDELHTPPREAIVQGLGFDRETVAAIVGSPNAGKTAFAVSLALHIGASEERWLGLKIAGGPVIYFGAEAPGSVIMRARAAAQHLQARPIAFYLSTAVPGLGGEMSALIDAERIIATVRQVTKQAGCAAVAVFLDTLAACLADGDENGDGMLRLVAAAKRIASETGCLVVLIHHPSKGDGSGLRGHGSLAAACDAIVHVESDELTKVRTATLTKARDCATGLQLRFELDPVTLTERDSFGDARTTIIVRPSNQPAPRPRPSGKRQEELLTELERRHRTGERSWDEAAICKAGRDLGMHRNSPRDALKALVRAGYLVGSTASMSLKHPPEVPA